jgi:hypothetical protein
MLHFYEGIISRFQTLEETDCAVKQVYERTTKTSPAKNINHCTWTMRRAEMSARSDQTKLGIAVHDLNSTSTRLVYYSLKHIWLTTGIPFLEFRWRICEGHHRPWRPGGAPSHHVCQGLDNDAGWPRRPGRNLLQAVTGSRRIPRSRSLRLAQQPDTLRLRPRRPRVQRTER